MRYRLLFLLASLAGTAHAADPCPVARTQLAAPDTATRIAGIACGEQWLWYRAFIDRQGRVANSGIMEAENRTLDDGLTPAWRRVAQYWRESGLLPWMAGSNGASDCTVAERGSPGVAACRAFVVDHAWSAVFVSWVLMKARLPGFRPSASHIDYVRRAARDAQDSAYEFHDIAQARPGKGDLLCYVRGGEVIGFEGVRAAVSRRDGLNMHCEIVVAATVGNDSTAYLIGGNVHQGVTLRLLPLNRNGVLWDLPRYSADEPPCSPDNEAGCSFNRQDWAVWLKLKPSASLAALPPPVPLVFPVRGTPVAPVCCVNCVVGSGVPRCPATP